MSEGQILSDMRREAMELRKRADELEATAKRWRREADEIERLIECRRRSA